MSVELIQTPFGTTDGGADAWLFSFTHASGLKFVVSNYGGVVQSLFTPDKNGQLADIVLGYDTLHEYEKDQRFLGCVVGRYANRIANGRFTLDGIEYQLEKNPSGHHIHGGSEGFHKQLWHPSVEHTNGLPQLVLQHNSPHGHGGYPGNLNCKVTYRVSAAGAIEVSYYAITDRPTIINLTNHSYFNLAGQNQATEDGILDHLVTLDCDAYLPTDDVGIPLSAPVTVAGTPMDFRTQCSLRARINHHHPQLENGSGYDHTWVVNGGGGALTRAASIVEPASGRRLDVETTQPGIQVYAGNQIERLAGKGGVTYQRRGALCLETQHFPDSPNWAEFPPTLVTPDKPFEEVTVFRPGICADR